jgi:hypothetical protein
MTVTTFTTVTPSHLPPGWFEVWQERAALMEDGGLSPTEADAEVLADILGRIIQGEEIGGACPCVTCNQGE